MESLVRFFTDHFTDIDKVVINETIINSLKKLNRTGRSELSVRLYEYARDNSGEVTKEQILNWYFHSFMLIDKYCFRFHNVYFSPGHDIKKNISKLILEAESNIDLCVFTISDPHLSKNLLYCAGKGIKIRIITDDYKTMARGSMVRNLAQNGILVKTDNSKSLMHNKFGIIDQRIAITGSFNWTLTATLHNQENILATSNVDIVNQYQAQFNRLWEKMFDLSLSD